MARAWPGTWPRRASGSSRQSGPAGRTAAATAKSDPLDAVSAARAAQSGRAAGAPKGRDGAVEAIRALTGDGRSARHERTQANGQARSLILTGPDDLRARFARLSAATLAEAIAALRPRPGDAAEYAVRVALRELGRRVEFPAASSSGWTS
jgi:transposase